MAKRTLCEELDGELSSHEADQLNCSALVDVSTLVRLGYYHKTDIVIIITCETQVRQEGIR